MVVEMQFCINKVRYVTHVTTVRSETIEVKDQHESLLGTPCMSRVQRTFIHPRTNPEAVGLLRGLLPLNATYRYSHLQYIGCNHRASGGENPYYKSLRTELKIMS